MSHATHHLTLNVSPLCVLSYCVFFQQAGYHFSKCGKLLLWCQYSGAGQCFSSSLPSIETSGTSCLAWWLQRLNSLSKGWSLWGDHKPHVTCLGTYSTSEIHPHEISRLLSKDCNCAACPEQKWTTSQFCEGPVQLVHKERVRLFSMILQLLVRPIKQDDISWGHTGDLFWLPHLNLLKKKVG